MRLLLTIFAVAALWAVPLQASAQSDAIRLGVGEITRAEGVVTPDQVVLSFPFEYRRTGTLRNDVRPNGRAASRTLYAAAGTPGYLLGQYRMSEQDTDTPVWCFFRPEHVDIDNIICFFGGYQGRSTVIEFTAPPLLITHFELQTRSSPTASAPEVEEGPVTLPFQLRATFRLISWRGQSVILGVSNGERDLRRHVVEPDARGQTVLRTVAGAVRFTRNAQNETVVESLPDQDQAGQRALTNLFASTGAATVESALLVLDSPAAHDFEPVTRDQDLFRQRVSPASAMRQETSPNNDDTYGEPGSLLFPVMRGIHPVMCWRAYPFRFLQWSGRMQADCLEDANHDGLYETMWPHVIYRDTSAFFVSSIVNTPQRLRAPVRLTSAEAAELPQSEIALRYLGPTRERRNVANDLQAAAVGFRWIVGRSYDPRVIEVELDANGEGVVVIAGAEIGRIRNADVATGRAEFQLISGLPPGRPHVPLGTPHRSSPGSAAAGGVSQASVWSGQQEHERPEALRAFQLICTDIWSAQLTICAGRRAPNRHWGNVSRGGVGSCC